MSLLQSARQDRGSGLLERRPLVFRTSSVDDESSVEEVGLPDTRLSADSTLPKSINWSLTYSSDEESQNQVKRARSFSEPGLENTTMRRRPRSFTLDTRATAPFSAPAAAAKDTSPRSRFTPVMCLAVVFFISCYTTFWLPYPEIPPVAKGDNFRLAVPPQMQKASLRAIESPQNNLIRGDAWMHARVEHAQKPLIYRKEDDALMKFYQQEAFTANSYTKQINIGMLVVVSLWAVWEHRRRKSHVMEL